MRDAVIVEAVRTPVGKRNGGLSGVHPVDLSAHVLTSLAERAGVDPAQVEDVIWGCVSQVGEQTFDIARTAALAAGWPETVTGPLAGPRVERPAGGLQIEQWRRGRSAAPAGNESIRTIERSDHA